MRRIRYFAALAALAVLYQGCGGAFAQDAVESRLTGLRLNGDQPIEIESDKLEVLEQENKAIFTGNVAVTQGPTIMKSGSMIVYYAKDGGSAATGSSNIERLEVDGKVYVKSDKQVATGDKGTFDMKTEVLVLSGSEVVLVGRQQRVARLQADRPDEVGPGPGRWMLEGRRQRPGADEARSFIQAVMTGQPSFLSRLFGRRQLAAPCGEAQRDCGLQGNPDRQGPDQKLQEPSRRERRLARRQGRRGRRPAWT